MHCLCSCLFVIAFACSCSVGTAFNFSRGTCPENYLTCETGERWRAPVTTEKCFSVHSLCDNETDCSDGSDEKYCAHNFNLGREGYIFKFVQGPCPFNFVMCRSGTQRHTSGVADRRCIKKEWICDGNKSCNDESDEKYCPYDMDAGFHFQLERGHCPQGYYKCKTGVPKNTATSIPEQNCIPKSWICDKNNDCADASDEKYCPYYFSEPETKTTTFPPEDENLNTTSQISFEQDIGGCRETFEVMSLYHTIVLPSFILAIVNTLIVLMCLIYVIYNVLQRHRLAYLHALSDLETHP